MINELIEEIKYSTSKHRYLNNKINELIVYLINLKYLCDTNIYSYEEVILNDDLYELNIDIKLIKRYIKDDKLPINRLLLKIKNINTKELLLEFLDTIEKPLCLHENDDNVAYLHVESNLLPFYDVKGNSTYIMRNPKVFEIAKLFDKILNINNKYISINDFENKGYDYIYVYDRFLRFSKYSDNILKEIGSLLNEKCNIVLIANYNKISNFREGIILIRNIKTIILDDAKAYIIFHNPKYDDEITIINTDKMKDKNKIRTIIKNNRKQKDILIKIKVKDMRENNYRIGFNLYRLEKTNIIKDINKIVDENTYYLDRLNVININVQKEINKLLNR